MNGMNIFSLNLFLMSKKTYSIRLFRYSMLMSDNIIISSINYISEDVIQVFYSTEKDFIVQSPQINVALAAFVTSYARLKLYKEMKQLGQRLLYCDTDSIIFVSNIDDKNEYVPKLGKFLGDFTDEVGGDNWIDEFVSAGPKNYAFKLNNGETVCKVKGFTLNYKASTILNMEAIKNIVLNDHQQKYGVESNSFLRSKYNWTITTKPMIKIYGFIYDKRVIKEDFYTYPYGF